MSIITSIFWIIIGFQSQGWDLLDNVSLKREFSDFMGQEVDVPVFTDELRKQEGNTLILEGYVIPLQQNTQQSYFVLSRFPYQSCFFCGAAGPETVVEVYSERSFKVTDQRVRVEGTLKLNEGDPLHLFYILNDAQVEILD
jgi:hypothetical protein